MSRTLKFIAAGLGLVVIIALAWMLLFDPIAGGYCHRVGEHRG